jgi:hypothetical protein
MKMKQERIWKMTPRNVVRKLGHLVQCSASVVLYYVGGAWRRWCGAALRDWFGGQRPTGDPCFALDGSTRQVVVGSSL